MNKVILILSVFVITSYSIEAVTLYNGKELESTQLSDECGYQLETSNIPGANSTLPAEYPWLGTLIYKNVTSGYEQSPCNVVLISNRYAITAGVCIIPKGSPDELLTVRLGTRRSLATTINCNTDKENEICTNGLVDFQIEQTIVHENFTNIHASKNDIALLRLKEIVILTDYIRPVCLSESTEQIEGDRKLRVVSWGKGENGVGGAKSQVAVKTVDNQECSLIYNREGEKINISDKQICAKVEGDYTACEMFSGASLLDERNNQFFLEGILSLGLPCHLNRGPEVYISIAKYKDWIESHIVN